jgi:hypothetical protein
LLENCIFHISPMYEFSHSLDRERTLSAMLDLHAREEHGDETLSEALQAAQK